MDQANRVTIKGVPLTCKHCGAEHFYCRRGQLNISAMAFFGLNWLDPSANIYACENCGFLHWFFSPFQDSEADDIALRSEPIPEDDTSTASSCLACGKTIPAGEDTCPFCGWSYRSVEESR